VLPNDLCYPLVGGTRERHFDGTNFKPRKLPETAPVPTCWVHALLVSFQSLQLEPFESSLFPQFLNSVDILVLQPIAIQED
jgi:hypothetical protein